MNSVNLAKQKVLIFGGLGFIGSNLAHALVKKGAEVTVYDGLLPGYGGNLFNVKDIEKDVKVIQKDIRDKAALEKAVKGQNLIFNFAAQVSYIDSLKDPYADLDINVRGHLMLMEACRALNREARVFFASSRMVYGRNTQDKVPETVIPKPLNMYGIHKLACEHYMELYNREFKIPAVAIRIMNPYGPRQQMLHSKYSLVGWFIRQAMEDKEIKIFGDGLQKRDYLYIDDLVNGFVAVAEKDIRNFECFNIGTGEGKPFRDMVQSVVKAVGKGKVTFVEWPKDYEMIETGSFVADTQKLTDLTGWKPEVFLDDGIRRTYEYYRENHKNYWMS